MPDFAPKNGRAEIINLLGERDWKPWWARNLTAAENAAVDEFLEYEPDVDQAWEDCLVDVKPCEQCGSLLAWWNPYGQQRCLRCDPPLKAIELLRWRRERAEEENGRAS